ncbi:hypothetical protein N7523_001752 [Penicillium sp. IBT 18751x]|nr:hypothetical protein N7523_001752 [Penicillium sp. IBT 18751x]
MPSPLKPTFSKTGTRKKLVPRAPKPSRSKSVGTKGDGPSEIIPIDDNVSSGASTAPQSTTVKPQLQESKNMELQGHFTKALTEDPREDHDPEQEMNEDEMNEFKALETALARGLAETVRHVNVFIDTSKDKHIAIPIIRLRDQSNFSEWMSAVELRLRMHQVWFHFCVLDYGEEVTPIPEDHELFLWYERTIDVASAIIYTSVSSDIRTHPCFLNSLRRRDLVNMMVHLICHYADDTDYSDSDLD